MPYSSKEKRKQYNKERKAKKLEDNKIAMESHKEVTMGIAVENLVIGDEFELDAVRWKVLALLDGFVLSSALEFSPTGDSYVERYQRSVLFGTIVKRC